MRETSPLGTMTVDEYFRFEERSRVRHEFVSGELYAMTGNTSRHITIVMNIGTRLHTASGAGSCRTYMNEMRLAVADDKHYYPDVVVICAPVGDQDVVARDACVVVEVTSPSTARIDRGEKLTGYRGLPSLRAYLIVDHRRRRVEPHWRDRLDGEWKREAIVSQGRVVIPCLDVELTLDEIYRRVELPAVGEPEAEYEPTDYEI
jgi:Uma2 family endonuclease